MDRNGHFIKMRFVQCFLLSQMISLPVQYSCGSSFVLTGYFGISHVNGIKRSTNWYLENWLHCWNYCPMEYHAGGFSCLCILLWRLSQQVLSKHWSTYLTTWCHIPKCCIARINVCSHQRPSMWEPQTHVTRHCLLDRYACHTGQKFDSEAQRVPIWKAW
jgi:hypothetical protein